jgi:hypothetical protein
MEEGFLSFYIQSKTASSGAASKATALEAATITQVNTARLKITGTRQFARNHSRRIMF